MQFQKDQSGKAAGAGRAIVQACVHAGLEGRGPGDRVGQAGVHPENETQKQEKQSLGRQDVHTKTAGFQPGGQALGGTAVDGRRGAHEDRPGVANRFESSFEVVGELSSLWA